MADAPSLNGSGSSRKSRYWHITSTSPCYNKTQGDARCVHQWKMSEPAGQLQCESREPEQDGSKQWKTRSHRLHCGRLCPSASNPLSRLSTMFYQDHSICSAGGSGVRSLPAVLRERDHILSCCLKALGVGCYHWHHDQS